MCGNSLIYKLLFSLYTSNSLNLFQILWIYVAVQNCLFHSPLPLPWLVLASAKLDTQRLTRPTIELVAVVAPNGSPRNGAGGHAGFCPRDPNNLALAQDLAVSCAVICRSLMTQAWPDPDRNRVGKTTERHSWSQLSPKCPRIISPNCILKSVTPSKICWANLVTPANPQPTSPSLCLNCVSVCSS